MDCRQKPIFSLPDNKAAVFQIYPLAATNGNLKDYILLGGGKLLTREEDDPHKIVILDLDYYFNMMKEEFPRDGQLAPEKDYFRPSFLQECWEAGKVVDLNTHRYGQSAFLQYDANDILTGKRTWTELIRVPVPVEPSESSQDESDLEKAYRPRFTKREGQKILDYIVRHNDFKITGGNYMWKKMEKRNVLPNRTEQSMKEHFRRKILPNITKYEISQENSEKLFAAIEGRKKKKRQKGRNIRSA